VLNGSSARVGFARRLGGGESEISTREITTVRGYHSTNTPVYKGEEESADKKDMKERQACEIGVFLYSISSSSSSSSWSGLHLVRQIS